jgi:hypothetical protein
MILTRYSSLLLIGLLCIFSGSVSGKIFANLHPRPSGAIEWNDSGPTATLLNVNDFHLWVDYRGHFPFDVSSGVDVPAGAYPPGLTTIFCEGILWGAKVDDGGPFRVRVNGSTYRSGLKAGKVLYDGGGNVIGSEDPAARHIWRVRPDYLTADLTDDAASFFGVNPDSISPIHIDTVYDQYAYDWQHWPVDEGAPFMDADDNDSYDPAVDIPGMSYATQTIWLVANDFPLIEGSDTTQVSIDSYGSPPIGMEMQMTLWVYDTNFGQGITTAEVIYKRVKLIYTGLPETPDTAHIDTMYITQWVNPDLGDYKDDFVGWDHNLDMGYAYNAYAQDDTFQAAGLGPPALGYTLLQGPIVDGQPFRCSTFFGKGSGSAISDPTLGIYKGSLQWFNLMEGFLPCPEYPAQDPIVHPLTGETTKFMLDGDPLIGTGWIDGTQLPPGERRFWMTTGPFSMALGDTQEVTLATTAALAPDNMASIKALRLFASTIRWYYTHRWVPVREQDVVPREEEILPSLFELGQNYPNPFNPITQIHYEVPWETHVKVAVYDILGREIVILVDRPAHAPGFYSLSWAGVDRTGLRMPSGIYLVRLEVLSPPVLPGKSTIKTRKMVLLR